MSKVLRVAKNKVGRDFIVGDIHGCFSKLSEHLKTIGFNADAGDRLFSVGDLVDRGPESEAALMWIEFPWFFAVAGNHEQMAIDWADGRIDEGIYRANGGMWKIYSTAQERCQRGDTFRVMPIAIELETSGGLVGIVHADIPGDSWGDFTSALNGGQSESFQTYAQWSRTRIQNEAGSVVAGVRAVVVGHTPLDSPVVIGNVHHIDTGGWHRSGAGFTLLDAETLLPVAIEQMAGCMVEEG